MTAQAALLSAIADRLEAAGIPFMVVGSVAASFHGEPRTTVDIDMVIDPSRESLTRFVEALPREAFYISAEAAQEALTRRTSFNVVEHATGWKVDLLIRKERPFSRSEFDRRFPAPLLGRSTPIATAEDVIVAKLEWAKAGESERQLRDVAGILAASGETLDLDYVANWIAELDLTDQWQRVRELADGA